MQQRAKVDGQHLLPRSTPRGRAGCQYPSSSGVELEPILCDCAARSSHCPRVRLSLEGCTALEGIAKRRMAGACAVSLFLCPKRVEALRLGVDRDRRKGLIRLDWAFLIKPPPVCAWCDAVFFTGSSWATACRCIAPRIFLPPRAGCDAGARAGGPRGGAGPFVFTSHKRISLYWDSEFAVHYSSA